MVQDLVRLLCDDSCEFVRSVSLGVLSGSPGSSNATGALLEIANDDGLAPSSRVRCMVCLLTMNAESETVRDAVAREATGPVLMAAGADTTSVAALVDLVADGDATPEARRTAIAWLLGMRAHSPEVKAALEVVGRGVNQDLAALALDALRKINYTAAHQ